MRKVLDYGLFVRAVNRLGAQMPDGSVNKAAFVAQLKEEYPPEKGWEIVNAEKVGEQAEGIIFAYYMQQVQYA